ncbi:MAG TPA: hypothetical protein ENF94_01955, partial [Candidatus Woesearchaeota archaeon]|nr:hypothetical protein [Candidatus Woesearchaeota archaeon]
MDSCANGRRTCFDVCSRSSESTGGPQMKVLIIGAGPAGSTAAFELRKNDKTAEITIIDDKTRGYSPCALPYTI